MIDRLRTEIQERLDQLLAEADKLRKALAALDPRGASKPTRPKTPPRSRTPAVRSASRSTRRTAKRSKPGTTKPKVLAVLTDGTAMTAGEVATTTGLGRGTVSTTLTKLAKTGEVRKAQRGYQLPARGS
jgi:CRP-like cAMP-binding protein